MGKPCKGRRRNESRRRIAAEPKALECAWLATAMDFIARSNRGTRIRGQHGERGRPARSFRRPAGNTELRWAPFGSDAQSRRVLRNLNSQAYAVPSARRRGLRAG